jgi:hypothetical protein
VLIGWVVEMSKATTTKEKKVTKKSQKGKASRRTTTTTATKKKNTYVNDDNHIWFKSRKNNGYQWLSNFWPHVDNPKSNVIDHVHNGLTKSSSSFIINDKSYASVEHYFQSMVCHSYNDMIIYILITN